MAILDRLILLIEARTKGAEKSIERLQNRLKSLQNLFLGLGLAFMFTGMAIARATQTALRALLQTFLMIEGEGGMVNETVNQLIAAWEFLKFSLIDAAVATGVFDKWIDRVQRLIGWFQGLDESQKALIVNSLVWGLIIGTVMSVVGQGLLFLLGTLSAIQFLFGSTAAILAGSIFVALLGILALVLIWKSDMSLTEKILFSITTVLAVIGLILLFFLNPLGLLLLGFALLIGVIILFRKQIAEAGFKFAKTVQEFMLDPLDFVINRLDKILNLIFKIADLGFGSVFSLAFGDKPFGGGVPEGAGGSSGGGSSGGTNNTLNLTIEGDVKDEDTLDRIKDIINDAMNFGSGSVNKPI